MAVQGRQRAASTLVRRAERVPGEDRGQAGAERGVAPLVPPPQSLPWAAGLLNCASCGQEWTERREQGPEHPEEAQDRGAGGHWDPSEEGPFPATHHEDTVAPPASLWEPPPPLGPWRPKSPDPGCLSKDTTRHEARTTQPSSTHISGRSEDWDGGGRAPWKGELMAGCPWLPLIMGI